MTCMCISDTASLEDTCGPSNVCRYVVIGLIEEYLAHWCLKTVGPENCNCPPWDEVDRLGTRIWEEFQ